MIGFGRIGQMVAQPLIAEGVPVTLLDHDADRVREAERFGSRVQFGDGTWREVRQAAGAGEARAIVVATDDPETTLATVRLLHRNFPHTALLVRAYGRIQAVRLGDADVPPDAILRETLASGLELGARTLRRSATARSRRTRRRRPFASATRSVSMSRSRPQGDRRAVWRSWTPSRPSR